MNKIIRQIQSSILCALTTRFTLPIISHFMTRILNFLLMGYLVTSAYGQTSAVLDKPKQTRNDQIYPAAAAAEKAISFDGSGFVINGQRTYISSGTIHYPRVPHELWHDRLLRMKQADFVNVETYCFWNYHEPRENEWNFTGDGDLEKFLTTAQDLGLTALVRVGPYVCAEWESGGWPLWLRFKPAMKLRTEDPEFLKWNTHWYDKILPIVAKHQIHKGGNVIMLQLENEHPQGWGVVNDDPYFANLRQQAEKQKIEIPWFFSGLNHGGSPAPSDINPETRQNPWFSTEFWAGWFDSYGLVADKKLRAIEKANWSIMAHGGGGQNYYMLHGGSNFDSWSDNSTGSSYDFGAAIGQAGDLRPSYYKMKRANLLAQSFPEILAHSTSAADNFKTFVKGNKIEMHGARRSAAGTLVFLRNNDRQENTATLADGGSLRIPRDTTVALPRDVILEKEIKLASATLPILAQARNAGDLTLVFYGQPGETGVINFGAKSLNVTVPEKTIAEDTFDLQGRAIRVLVIPQDLSLRVWRVGPPDKQLLVFGPAFVTDVTEKDGKPLVTFERYREQPACGQIAVYGGKGQSWHLSAPANPDLEKVVAPLLSSWRTVAADAPADPKFDDKSWFASELPMQMGADGDNGSYAWYRAKINAPKAGSGQLNCKLRDDGIVYLNGKRVEKNGNSYRADFLAGENSLAVFVSHAGRNKGFCYCKLAADLDPKGFQGEVTTEIDKQKMPVTGWKMRGYPGLSSAVWTNPAAETGWNPFVNASGGPAFYHATFDTTPPGDLGVHPILRLEWAGLGRGMVWVNGHSLGRYPEKIRVDSLYIPEPWLKAGSNDVVIFDETGSSPAEARLVVDSASREVAQSGVPIAAETPFVLPQEFRIVDLVALNAGNLAFNAAVKSSADYNKETAAGLATDGNPETSWKPAGNNGAGMQKPWLAVELKEKTALGVVEILWDGKSRDYKYTLEGSLDGMTWVKIGDQTTAVPSSPDSPSEMSRLKFTGQSYQQLRVTVDDGKSPAIAEVRVFSSVK
jgi:beta-galactosidase